jgi:hypothetical protein
LFTSLPAGNPLLRLGHQPGKMLGRMFVCHDEDDTAGDVCRPMRQIKMSNCQAFIEPQFRFRG